MLSGWRLYRRLLSYVGPYWLVFSSGLIATLLLAGIDAGLIGFLKPLLNKGFVTRDERFIVLLPFIMLVALLLRGGTNFASGYCLAWVARSVVTRLRQEIFSHLLRLPAHFYDNTTSGQILATIIYNAEQVASASTEAMVTVLQEGFFIIGLISVMLSSSWQLSLLFFLTVPIMVGAAHYSSRRIRRLNKKVQESIGNITSTADATIGGYKVTRIFGKQSYEVERFSDLLRKNRIFELKVVVTQMLASTSIQCIAASVVATSVYLATTRLAQITAGDFTVLITAMLVLLKPTRNLVSVNSSIQKGLAAADGIFTLLDEPLEKDKGGLALKRAKGALKYEHIHFGYRKGQEILHDINFQVNPGKTLALVGHSGSGKSTLINLLPRFYDYYTGNILIDHVDNRAYALKDLRSQFALVSQPITLFNDTIAHNIAYGYPDGVISSAKITRAAEAAHAIEFISQLPQGLNTLIGENGVLLSEGQRQRIAIARALLKNAPFLLLDEATSALDTEAERYIQAALIELMRNRTTLVIAHRLSTVKQATQIVVLEAGRIVEIGSHENLLAQKGHYARLYHLQFNH